jgi:hypothetical protein
VNVLNTGLASISLLLALVGAYSMVAFADLEGLFTDLNSLLALLLLLLVRFRLPLADLLGFSGDNLKIVEVFLAALDFVRVVAGLANLLDHHLIGVVDFFFLVIIVSLSLSWKIKMHLFFGNRTGWQTVYYYALSQLLISSGTNRMYLSALT